jgi:hypothetical protein
MKLKGIFLDILYTLTRAKSRDNNSRSPWLSFFSCIAPHANNFLSFYLSFLYGWRLGDLAVGTGSMLPMECFNQNSIIMGKKLEL